MIFRIKSKFYRELGKIFGYRPNSYPYLTGDGLRLLADHIYDDDKKCAARDIKLAEIVFLQSDKIDEWFKNVHPNIEASYKLITHNGDRCVGEKEVLYIDNKIIKWFAQNNTYSHAKVIPIPIGIENRALFYHGWAFEKRARKLLRNKTEKINRIIVGFNPSTNPMERNAALTALKKSSAADEIKTRVNPFQYFEMLNKYKFVASPEGNGPDCIRTWEALALGVIPIVKNTSDCQIISQNTFPILVINNWDEVVEMTEERLASIFSQYESVEKSDITKLDYWENIIRKYE